MRFQIGKLISNLTVGDGMGPVESIVCKTDDKVVHIIGSGSLYPFFNALKRNAPSPGPTLPSSSSRRPFSEGPLPRVKSRHLRSNLHDLLLIDDDS